MADTKLGMSLDDIIQTNTKTKKKAVRRGGRPPKRGAAEAMDADSAAPKARGGVRKAGARRNPRKAPEEPQQSGRTLRPRRKRRGGETGEDDDLIENGLKSGEFIKVGGTSQTNAVAGKIAHEARLGQPPALLAKGPASLNQAIKAVAVARQYLLEEKSDLTCQPAFRDDKQLASLALYLAKRRPVAFPRRNVHGFKLLAPSILEQVQELTVGKESNPHLIAGAIAARVREDKPVALTSIGDQAATIAMRAICSGRLYLEDDKCDIKALIEFETVEKEEGRNGKPSTLNALRFNILVEDV